MKDLTAVLDEIFTVDIKEGDIEDSWNSITDKNGVVFDFNFSWEDTKGCEPNLSIYGLIENGDGTWSINTSDETTFKILGKPSADVFFKEARFKYKFDVSSKITGKVYNDKDEVVFTTKSFNRLSDELCIRKMKGESVYAIIMDKNNATKRID
jgi:hypothetical protein